MRTFSVSLVSKDPAEAADDFYKYVGDHVPSVGEIIVVMRFVRGRKIRARVTRVDTNYSPQIRATQIG
jgi:hypothetical protein